MGSGQWEEGKERGRRGGESDTWESTVGYVFEGTEGQRHVGFKGCSGSMHAHTYQLPLHVVSVQCIRKSAVKRVIKGGFGGKSPKSHRAGAAVRVRERECESVSKIFETTKICEC